MTYAEKLWTAQHKLAEALQAAKQPILWCSFGKKSAIVLDLIRGLEFKNKVPVFWMRPADLSFEARQRFRTLIREYKLEVLDYWPSEYLISGLPGEIRIGQIYDLGEGAALPLVFPLQIEAYKEEGWICVFNLLQKRKEVPYPYAWDLSIFGSIGDLPADGSRVGKTLLLFPLRDWHAGDIETYLKEHEVPKGIEPGRFPVCSNCIDPVYRLNGTVYCPLVETHINWMDIKIDERNKLWESVIANE